MSEEVISTESLLTEEGKISEEKKKELERQLLEKQKNEINRKLVIKANQIRAFCFAHNPEFFEIGKEMCELLEKFFPEDAKKLKEKIMSKQKKDERQPGSVNYPELLSEIEGLAKKAFKTMLENFKGSGSAAPSNVNNAKLNAAKYDQQLEANKQKQQEIENKIKASKDAEKTAAEKEKNRPAQNYDKPKGKSDFAQSLQDAYMEGFTGKKIERKEEKETKVKLPEVKKDKNYKKEQKLLAKEQKKLQKEQRKLERQGKEKVSSLSAEELAKAKEELSGNKPKISQEEADKLKEYNQRKATQAEQSSQSHSNDYSSQEQSMGMSMNRDPSPSTHSTKPKR